MVYNFNIYFDRFFCSFIKQGYKLRALYWFNELLFRLKVRLLCLYKYDQTYLYRDPVYVVETAFRLARPIVGLRLLKLGGLVYRVPVLITEHKRLVLTITFFVRSLQMLLRSRDIKKVNFFNVSSSLNVFILLNLVYDASQGMGDALKLRDDIHLLATKNRTFLRFFRKR